MNRGLPSDCAIPYSLDSLFCLEFLPRTWTFLSIPPFLGPAGGNWEKVEGK